MTGILEWRTPWVAMSLWKEAEDLDCPSQESPTQGSWRSPHHLWLIHFGLKRESIMLDSHVQ